MNPGCTELHRVAPNVPRPVLNRRGLGEQPDGALGRGVRGRTPVAWANCNYAGNGRGIDDRPSAGRPHGRNGSARTQENALAVYLQDPVPFRRFNGVNLGGSRAPSALHSSDTRIVDQDIQLAVFRDGTGHSASPLVGLRGIRYFSRLLFQDFLNVAPCIFAELPIGTGHYREIGFHCSNDNVLRVGLKRPQIKFVWFG
jgi:hypothetical protein